MAVDNVTISGGKVFHKKGTLIRVPVGIDSRANRL